MKPMFKILLVAVLGFTSLVYGAEDTPTANADKVLENNSYVEAMPDQGSCKFSCPTMKAEYFARIRDVIPSRGETQCFVYKNADPSTILGYISVTNAKCQEQFNLTDAEKYQVKTSGEVSSDEFGLNTIRAKYSEHFTNTGTREYLRTSKYVLAGLTADSEILNLQDSINKNQLVLNEGYTIYPNATALPDKDFAQTVLDTIGGWWASAVSFASGNEIVKEQYKGYSSTLSSLNEIVFSNVIVMVINWLAQSNEVLLDMNSTLFFFVIPLTGGLFLLGKATKALGDKQDHEDNYEKLFLTFVILFVFYFGSTETNVNENKITQTNFQTWSRPVLYEGATFADKLTMAFTTAYINYKARDAGLMMQDGYAKIHDQTAILTKENEVLEKDGGMLGTCYQVYDTERLYNLASTTVGANTVFPPLGTLNKDRRGKPNANGTKDLNFGISNLEETSFMQPQYRRATNVPTLSACYNFERRYQENKKIIEKNEIIKKQYESAINSNKTKEGMRLVAELLYKNSAEMGFLNASNIASANILINNLDLFVNTDIKEASVEHTMELDAQVNAIHETSNIVSSDLYFATRWFAENTPYMMVPPASVLKNDVIAPAVQTGIYFGSLFSNWIINKISNVAFVTAPVRKILGIAFEKIEKIGKMASGEKDSFSKIFDVSISFIALILTILFMKYFLAYMPLVAISVAGYLAIGFYYISVEIFYLVAPFIAIYALSTDQMNILKSFFSRFLALAFKPVLIVLSIIIAIMANELFDKLAFLSSHKTFDTFFAITQYNRTAVDSSGVIALFDSVSNGVSNFITDWNDYGLLFFKGSLLVGAKVVSLVVVFYLVFYGSTMILNIFGMKDSGIDAQDTVGSSIDSKTSKYNMSM